MKNRAKCKLCESVIESFHRHDFVSCKCGEISVDGGQDYFKCMYSNKDNFLRVDDEGNVIVPTFKEKEPEIESTKLSEVVVTKEDKRTLLIDAVEEMIKAVEGLPQNAMTTPVTQYDYASLLLMFSSMLKLGLDD